MSVPNFNPLDYPPTTKETATRRFHEDRATCGVWILDASGDILDANEQGCYMAPYYVRCHQGQSKLNKGYGDDSCKKQPFHRVV